MPELPELQAHAERLSEQFSGAVLDALLQLGVVRSNPFPPNSRYANVATAIMTAPDGSTITYLRRRFVPQPSSLASVGEYTVVQGDRLD